MGCSDNLVSIANDAQRNLYINLVNQFANSGGNTILGIQSGQTYGATDVITVDPGVGYMGRLLGVNFSSPAVSGAASGSQQLNIGYDLISANSYMHHPLLQVTNPYNNSLIVEGNTVNEGSVVGSTSVDFQTKLDNAFFDHTTPLQMIYQNNTNVAQSAVRNGVVYWLKMAEDDI
jgi:hypothetical protein